MTNRNSFLLHLDSLAILDRMPDDMAGRFIKAIYYYQSTGELPEMDLALEMAIVPFINQFKRDEAKYQSVVERNRSNGLSGGRPKENPSKPKKPTGLFTNPSKPKKADSDNDSDSDNVNDSDNDFINKKNTREESESCVVDYLTKDEIENSMLNDWNLKRMVMTSRKFDESEYESAVLEFISEQSLSEGSNSGLNRRLSELHKHFNAWCRSHSKSLKTQKNGQNEGAPKSVFTHAMKVMDELNGAKD